MVVCRCLYDSFVVRWLFNLWMFLLQKIREMLNRKDFGTAKTLRAQRVLFISWSGPRLNTLRCPSELNRAGGRSEKEPWPSGRLSVEVVYHAFYTVLHQVMGDVVTLWSYDRYSRIISGEIMGTLVHCCVAASYLRCLKTYPFSLFCLRFLNEFR